MSTRIALPLVFLALMSVGAYRTLQVGNPTQAGVSLQAGEIERLRRATPPEEPGSFPREWIYGGDCETEPKIQAHRYSANVWILRQSKCTTFEAPFLYLIFGEEKALLMDTGAVPGPWPGSGSPVQETVNGIIRQWLLENGRASIPLIVAHTHGHGDHVAGDPQFVGISYVEQLVPAAFNQAIPFWGYKDYPEDVPTIDLGNRVIDVLGTPGHHPASVTLYDRKTQLLITADIVYPGHLFVFSAGAWPDFVTSIQRLVDWAATHPVTWVMGCHIEMSDTPFGSYQYTTPVQPDEHTLEFRPTILTDVLAASLGMGNDPQCEIFEEIVIHPVYLCGILWND